MPAAAGRWLRHESEESVALVDESTSQRLSPDRERPLCRGVLLLPFAVSTLTGGYPRAERSYGEARMSSTRMSRASSKQSATRSEQIIGESRKACL